MATRVRGGVVAVVLGVATAAVGGYLLVPHVQAMSTAEPVEVVVPSTDLERATTADGSSAGYYALVSCEYTYRSTEYASDSVFPGRDHATDEEEARAIVTANPAGQRATPPSFPGTRSSRSR